MLIFFFVLVNFRALKWVLPTTLRVYGLRPSGKTKGSLPQLRAFPHSKAQSAGFRATTQLMHLIDINLSLEARQQAG